jgi:RNA polymerase sigma factor (sigma-70 family)
MQTRISIPSDAVTRPLYVRAREGSASARDQLLRIHRGLVIHIANRFYRPGAFLEMGDLIQQGSLGLLRAIEKFNPARKRKGKLICFTTYAHFWISHFIRREIEAHGRTIAVPIRRLNASLSNGQTSEPETCSLDQSDEWVEDENGIARMRLVDLSDTSDSWCSAWEQRRTVEALLGRVPEQSRKVLRWRFGFESSDHPITQKQTAQKMNVQASRVGQIERAALRRLGVVARQMSILP